MGWQKTEEERERGESGLAENRGGGRKRGWWVGRKQKRREKEGRVGWQKTEEEGERGESGLAENRREKEERVGWQKAEEERERGDDGLAENRREKEGRVGWQKTEEERERGESGLAENRRGGRKRGEWVGRKQKRREKEERVGLQKTEEERERGESGLAENRRERREWVGRKQKRREKEERVGWQKTGEKVERVGWQKTEEEGERGESGLAENRRGGRKRREWVGRKQKRRGKEKENIGWVGIAGVNARGLNSSQFPSTNRIQVVDSVLQMPTWCQNSICYTFRTRRRLLNECDLFQCHISCPVDGIKYTVKGKLWERKSVTIFHRHLSRQFIDRV